MASFDTRRCKALGWAVGVLWRLTALPTVCLTLCPIGFLTAPLLSGSLSAQSLTDAFPSQEIVLADWGMSDVSEVGYLHFGVLHRPAGDTLAIYDVRRRAPVVARPVVPTPGEPRRSPAPLDGDVFLVGHFDRGNTNRLGGYFNGFARAPSTSHVSIARAPDDGPALAYSYDNAAGSFAGFWIHLFDFKRPPTERVFFDASPFAYLTFEIRGERGGENLTLQLADRAWEQREGSLPIGDIASFLPEGRVEPTWQRVWVSSDEWPPGLNTRELASLVFLTNGEGSGRVFLKDIAFTHDRDAEIPTAEKYEEPGRSLKKAMWLWETPAVTSGPDARRRLVQFCRTEGITDLFLQLPYEAERIDDLWTVSWDRERLRPLIADLHAAGVTVHALDGDPRFSLPYWHGQVIATIQSIAEYNRESPPAERFDGIRYDIEPYLLPGFGGVRRTQILQQYLAIVGASQALAARAGLVYGVDIPAWFDERNEFFELVADVEGRLLSELIIDIVDNVGIMDYRTQAYGADGTIAHAESELRYAAGLGKKVFLGLETVELPDETDFAFSSEGLGGSRVVVEQIDDERVRISWIAEEPWDRLDRGRRTTGTRTETGAGTRRVILRESRATEVPSDKLSFARFGRSELDAVMENTALELQQFESFYGFAIHSYESYRKCLEGPQ